MTYSHSLRLSTWLLFAVIVCACDEPGNGSTQCGTPGQPACTAPRPNACIENTAPSCTDGIDNNYDGSTDCRDSTCADRPECIGPQGPEDSLETCTDGFDNDRNGFTDCGDFACSQSSAPAILNHCDSLAENSLQTHLRHLEAGARRAS